MPVNTVLGPIEADELGLTLVHEHLVIGWPGSELDTTRRLDRRAAVTVCTERAAALVEQGVRTIVDPCPIELGRDPELAAEVADASGLHIVIATGLYNQDVGYPFYFRQLTTEQLTDLFVAELTEGIGNSGILAGVLKCSAGGIPGLTPQRDQPHELGEHEERAHRAAARASLVTGAPIITHNDELNPLGRAQVAVFADEGVDLDRVLIGHVGGVGQMRYYFRILEAGASLGFDRFGVEALVSDEFRLASLIGLLQVGYADRLFISTDSAMCWRGSVGSAMEEFLARSPRWGATHIVDWLIPRLYDAGVTREQIEQLVVANPRRLLAGT